jgi:hypothetical protein
VVQYFSAGLGLLGGETMEFHEGFGYAAVHLFPILMLLVGLVSRLPRALLILTFVLAVVTLVQPIWVSEFRGELLGAFHLLGALLIAWLARDIAERAVRFWRTRASA